MQLCHSTNVDDFLKPTSMQCVSQDARSTIHAKSHRHKSPHRLRNRDRPTSFFATKHTNNANDAQMNEKAPTKHPDHQSPSHSSAKTHFPFLLVASQYLSSTCSLSITSAKTLNSASSCVLGKSTFHTPGASLVLANACR